MNRLGILNRGFGKLSSRSFSWAAYWAGQRNPDLIVVNTLNVLSPLGVNFTTNGTDYSAWWNYLKFERIRQDGVIEKIVLSEINALTNLIIFDFEIWRYNGATHDLVHTLDLLPLVSVGNNTLILASPIPVLENDLFGFKSKTSAGDVGIFGLTYLAVPKYCYYDYSAVDLESPVDISSKSAIGHMNVSHLYEQAPLIIAIGDSIMACNPLHHSYIDVVATIAYANDPSKTWQYKLKQKLSSAVYQNMGIGGNTTTEILARFDAHVIAFKPVIAVINGGTNDVGLGTVNEATMLSNYTSMLDKCIAASIIPVVWSIQPWTSGSHANHQDIDSRNIALAALVGTYPTAHFINWDPILGQFHTGGDAGNLWDKITAYNQDGTHNNEAGNQVVADEMYRILTTN